MISSIRTDQLSPTIWMGIHQPPVICEGILNQAKANPDGVKIQGEALIIACKNQEIAEFIINDKSLSKWCQRLDKLQIVLPGSKEKKFRDILNTMGIGCS